MVDALHRYLLGRDVELHRDHDGSDQRTDSADQSSYVVPTIRHRRKSFLAFDDGLRRRLAILIESATDQVDDARELVVVAQGFPGHLGEVVA